MLCKCCADVSPHLLFNWFLKADIPPSVISSYFTCISFNTNNRLLFSSPLDLRRKKKFTTTEVFFYFPTPRFLAKIYKEIHILVPLFPDFLMSYYRAWISNLFHKLIFFGFSEQNCLLRVLT